MKNVFFYWTGIINYFTGLSRQIELILLCISVFANLFSAVINVELHFNFTAKLPTVLQVPHRLRSLWAWRNSCNTLQKLRTWAGSMSIFNLVLTVDLSLVAGKLHEFGPFLRRAPRRRHPTTVKLL